MGERIRSVDWMSDQTKEKALEKLHAFKVKIGYPDKWIDYSNLNINKDSYYANVKRANIFEFKRDLAKIGKPVDKTEWLLNAQTVNAYYSGEKNEIAFPAAILQPPFFNLNADDAVNYGAMGAVIGHEITHGFDDEGRQFDANGNLTDWWTKEDSKKFDDKAEVMIEQFNKYSPIDTFHVNGQLTQGENIADLGGLNVALTAFKKTDEYKEGKKIDGFTPVQRFFFGWAQVWESNSRDQSILMALKVDPHSPDKFRVNGPLSNMPEFWDAFNIKPGQPMRRTGERVIKIW